MIFTFRGDIRYCHPLYLISKFESYKTSSVKSVFLFVMNIVMDNKIAAPRASNI